MHMHGISNVYSDNFKIQNKNMRRKTKDNFPPKNNLVAFAAEISLATFLWFLWHVCVWLIRKIEVKTEIFSPLYHIILLNIL